MTKSTLLASASSAALPRTPPSAKHEAKKPTEPKLKKPRFAKLDGKPPPRARGRHARSDTSSEADKAITIPVNQRLGFRPNEYAALVGISSVTVWRGMRDGKIDFIEEGGVKIIPRAYAIKRGLITADDAT